MGAKVHCDAARAAEPFPLGAYGGSACSLPSARRAAPWGKLP